MKSATNFFFAAFCLMFLAYVYRPMPTNHLSSSSESKQPEFEASTERAETYRGQLGDKLNRERIGIEYENTFTAKSRHLQPVAAKDPISNPLADPMVQDLAFDNEPALLHRREPEHRILAKSPAEMAVQYAMMEHKQDLAWATEEQKQFVRDYVANARAQGYEVAVDRDYNVKVLREPQSVQMAEAEFEKSNREPQSFEQPKTFRQKPSRISRAFTYAPYCSKN